MNQVSVSEFLVAEAMGTIPEKMFRLAKEKPELIPAPETIIERGNTLYENVERTIKQLETVASFGV
jgi:hypothetical protein